MSDLSGTDVFNQGSVLVASMEQNPESSGVTAESPLTPVFEKTPVGSPSASATVHMEEVGLLTHLSLRGNAEESGFAAGVSSALGTGLPKALQSEVKGEICIRWIGPDEWLITAPGTEAFALERNLRSQLDGHFSIVNVSGGQTVITLRGANAATVLRKSTPYDVHPRNFPVGKVVTSVLAKSQAVIRRSGEQEWELVVRRSFAEYLWAWLQDAGREFV